MASQREKTYWIRYMRSTEGKTAVRLCLKSLLVTALQNLNLLFMRAATMRVAAERHVATKNSTTYV